MEYIKEYLIEQASQYKIEITSLQADKFQKYMLLLLEWNKKINLTAIIEPKAVVLKHFLDSILLIPHIKCESKKKLIDVGTGAGFPGVPLAMLTPMLEVTLLDSLNKRLTFLKELAEELQINVKTVHARAEEGGRNKELREKFDYVTARAVAPLNLLCEYCLPFVRLGGNFLAMKGPEVQQEVNSAKRAVAELGCEIEKIYSYSLPGGDGRTLVQIRRTKMLPERYPRHGSKIANQPL